MAVGVKGCSVWWSFAGHHFGLGRATAGMVLRICGCPAPIVFVVQSPSCSWSRPYRVGRTHKIVVIPDRDGVLTCLAGIARGQRVPVLERDSDDGFCLIGGNAHSSDPDADHESGVPDGTVHQRPLGTVSVRASRIVSETVFSTRCANNARPELHPPAILNPCVCEPSSSASSPWPVHPPSPNRAGCSCASG